MTDATNSIGRPSTPSSAPARDFVRIENVGMTFKTKKGPFIALRDIDLTICRGEFVSLIGHSGCGKSTLLNLVAGLIAPSGGVLLCAGREIAGPGPERGVVFQNHSLLPWLTCFDNVHLAVERVFGASETRADLKRRTLEVLALVGLTHAEHKFPHEISGGMKQRVGIARALAMQPKVLLLDEPFGALDAKVRKELRSWLRRLHDDLHISTLFVTHDQEEALEVADRIVVLNRGHVEQVGSPQDVYDHPQTSFVYEFLGAANRLHGSVARNGFVAEGAAQPIAIEAAFEGPALAYVRPHDLVLYPQAAGGHTDGIKVGVRRVVTLGGSVRVELEGQGGHLLEAELDRETWRELRLAVGDGATAVPRALRVFPAQ